MKNLSSCTVFIVDDTEENIDVLIETLGDNYDIAVATGGTMALQLVEEINPDLILLDLVMEDMHGYEVCEKLKENENTKDIPIIFLTSKTDVESKIKAFELGGVDYITKPFESIEVNARVKNHLLLQLAKINAENQNEILERKVRERTKEIDLIKIASIDAIGNLAECRDPETGGHIKRTKNYVEILLKQLKKMDKYKDILTDNTIEEYVNSAPLHDIGKVGIPDEILLKPGKLTPEEFEVMKGHCKIGADSLIESSKRLGKYTFLDLAIEFALTHHEKWDGSGYPKGLKEENIPLSGRVMALADVYDALTTKRVYKPAFTHEKAIEIIEEGRGTHFDPTLVDILIEHGKVFEKISKLTDKELGVE